jgi:hypothetical protein
LLFYCGCYAFHRAFKHLLFCHNKLLTFEVLFNLITASTAFGRFGNKCLFGKRNAGSLAQPTDTGFDIGMDGNRKVYECIIGINIFRQPKASIFPTKKSCIAGVKQ